MNNNQIGLGVVNPEADLEWMLQSEQITDINLVRALVHDNYPEIKQLAVFYLSGDKSWQAVPLDEIHAAAGEIAEQALIKVVMDRHRYWGEPALPAWIYGKAMGFIRKAVPAFLASPSDPATQIGPGVTLKNDADLAMEQALNSLGKHERLLLWLRYTNHLSLSGMAYVLHENRRNLASELQAARETLQQAYERLEPASDQADPPVAHRSIQRLLHASLDGAATPEELGSIAEHLQNCPSCQAYARRLDKYEKHLAGFLQIVWPEPRLSEGEEGSVLEAISRRLGNGGVRRKISINLKESAIIGLIILLVVAVGWGIKVMAPNADPIPPDGIGVQAANIQDATSAPSDAPNLSALPTPSAGDIRPWYNGDGSSPREGFIDLSQTVLKTDPLTSTNDIRLSGSMSLEVLMRFWGSIGTSVDSLQPNRSDFFTTPAELVRFINANTNLKAESRVGGNLELLKKLITAGFPVIIERGVDGEASGGVSGWVGRFDVVNGYNDRQHSLSMLSSYQAPGTYSNLFYGSFLQQWRAFDYTYLVVYDFQAETLVDQILGPQVSSDYNFRQAAEMASVDTYSTIYVRDQFFSWFNRGMILVSLRRYQDAASSFDQAFSLYHKIPQSEVPWRLLWYQTDFYQAFYTIGRYQDVIDLASMVIDGPGNARSEQSFYWRALAKAALGNKPGAIQDLEVSLQINPKFGPGIARLQELKNGS